MSAPTVKRFLPFEQEIVALIDRRNSGNRAGLVVEDLIRDVGWHAQACHPRNDGASQIMQSPSSDTRAFVKFRLGLTKILKVRPT
jgi:hypothetical protein